MTDEEILEKTQGEFPHEYYEIISFAFNKALAEGHNIRTAIACARDVVDDVDLCSEMSQDRVNRKMNHIHMGGYNES